MATCGTTISDPIVIIVGPTAIGKTALSLRVADTLNCEIISMDSMQVYRFMDIGTAKASKEEQHLVPHHLLDIRYPDEQYDAAQFVTDALSAIKSITKKGKTPLITGGTGLYLSSLLNGLFENIHVKDEVRMVVKKQLKKEGREALYSELKRIDPVAAARIHANDTQRLLRGLEIFYSSGIPWTEHILQQQERGDKVTFSNLFQIGLTCERDLLYRQIADRTKKMIESGLEQEVLQLRKRGYKRELSTMQSIGYRHMNAHIDGEWDKETTTEILIRDTRRYAKRQMTWFGKHKQLRWYDKDNVDKAMEDLNVFIDRCNAV